jgi:outer membrane lipopolysaccharide assembly protein LptE/RlpB
MRISSQSCLRTFFAVTAAFLLTACGYQFGGQGGVFPNDIRTIYVESFISRARNIGVEQEITSALRSEIYRRGQVRLVEQPDQADAIVSGVVRSLELQVASVNREDEVLQYEAILVLDVNLRRRQPSEILWRGTGTRLTQIYGGSRAAIVTTSSDFRRGTLNAIDVRRMTDVQLTESERSEVRRELIDRFARELHERLTETF